ncbi:MAG: YggT family protein [Armatimonadetes bacterium]|nr:YggT family protein [Armatimonadota bacterium]
MTRSGGWVALVFQAYYLVLLARVLMSWIRPRRGSVLAERVMPLLYMLTEPLLAPIRRALRPYMGATPVDFSPLVLVLVLSVVETLILRLLGAAGR